MLPYNMSYVHSGLVRSANHSAIMQSVEVQFAPIRNELLDEHTRLLRSAQGLARKTNNAGAMLPAEAKCYIEHAQALVVARAQCMAEAYTTFNTPARQEAQAELAQFFAQVVGGRRSAFEGEVRLRESRTNQVFGQLPFILRSFEKEANDGLVKGRAILERQRVEFEHQPATPPTTKYVIDTCVFNWLTDRKVEKGQLPRDGGFAITHIQVDEMNATKDQERRACLFLIQTELHCKLLPTETALWGESRWDYAKWGEGKSYLGIKSDLDTLNKGKNNNHRDALIAETAILNGLTLITADKDLRIVTEKHGGKVFFFPKP